MCRYVIVRSDISREIVGSAEAEGEAQALAQSLASEEHNTTFEVYQIIGTARTEPRVVWKGVTA